MSDHVVLVAELRCDTASRFLYQSDRWKDDRQMMVLSCRNDGIDDGALPTTASVKLRMIDGNETAAMVYDRQPIVDYFRRIDDNAFAGMMVVEGDEQRYFFRLRKADVSGGEGGA
ncbi:DUF4334 domain-containing protein [Rhizobium sp. P32RR-XVIII]|nr:DUF4334 domain-containing protein [Rhizobium sp. P32RR-XVIII]